MDATQVLLTISIILLATVNLFFLPEFRESRLIGALLKKLGQLMRIAAREESEVERRARASAIGHAITLLVAAAVAFGDLSLRGNVGLWLFVGAIFVSSLIHTIRDPDIRPRWLAWADSLPTHVIGVIVLLIGVALGLIVIWK